MDQVKKAPRDKKPYDIMRELQEEPKKEQEAQAAANDKILKQLQAMKERREELLIYREQLWKELELVNNKLINYDKRIEKKTSQLFNNS